MIHYTLLPEKEMKTLRKEYRIRVLVMFLFFVSCGVVVGIGFLIPSYILSYNQEKDSIKKIESIQKDRQVSGIDNILKELSSSSDLINKLKKDSDPVIFSDILKIVLNHKPESISVQAIQMSKGTSATGTVEVILQGKSTTREAVLSLKKTLEQDAHVVKVELPISDLAKSKNLSFSVRISIKTPYEN